MNLFRYCLLLSVFAAAGLFAATQTADAGDCCRPCPPPPHVVCFCVQDPCTGCIYEVSACVPACCCGQPCLVDWRKGLLGRKVLTYRFECGQCVEVVVTRNGNAKVRG